MKDDKALKHAKNVQGKEQQQQQQQTETSQKEKQTYLDLRGNLDAAVEKLGHLVEVLLSEASAERENKHQR